MDDVALIKTSLADELGLTAKPGGLAGPLDGAPLEVTVAVVNVGHHHGRVYDLKSGTYIDAGGQHGPILVADARLPFRPRLDAGLKIAPVGTFDGLRSAGRSGFSGRFAIRGAELDRVEALVGEVARDALDRAFVGDAGPTVDDGGIQWRLQRGSPWPTVAEMAGAIRELPVVWRAVHEACRAVRPPAGVEDGVVRLARLRLPAGVELVGCPAGISGVIDGVSVAVSVGGADTRGRSVRVAIDLRRPLPGGPQIVREARFGWLDRLGALLTGRPEITTGDDDFDERFAVRSLRPDVLQSALGPEVREAMLALDTLLPIQLGPAGIAGTGRVHDVDLERTARAALALAEALTSRE
jgi:hypothetical protein